ncbi:MAG: hypothetical protein AB3X44_00645 [Leptothrix sp. (in: b-proteobacteria)]
MATPNYSYEKRQRELAKKRKTEEKRQRKSHPSQDGSGQQDQQGPDGNPASSNLPGNRDTSAT